jgi:hypothetical protein
MARSPCIQLADTDLNRCVESIKLAKGIVRSGLPRRVSRLILMLSLLASSLSVHPSHTISDSPSIVVGSIELTSAWTL